ncbi:hypothetical protein [Micromonospora sp. KC213]|uniref:hypothetical protein n=1 Tax=Micromonospora sp. KC213 TaxID=2530378 RepID=UPI00104526A4|nr:hypothetical protein [Micromonospora sp. KC213]TDC41405.1 hypothetical protein E1166_11820 [Micromonospora sp. KC213]
MTSVKLLLPPEVIDELALPYEGVRDISAVTLAIEGVGVLANLATLATLQPQLGALATAIRNWRLRDERQSVVLTVKGPDIDLKLDLPRNVSTAALLKQLAPLFDEEGGRARSR